MDEVAVNSSTLTYEKIVRIVNIMRFPMFEQVEKALIDLTPVEQLFKLKRLSNNLEVNIEYRRAAIRHLEILTKETK